MNKKVTLKDIAIMQSGIYMKTDSQGEVRYLQVKDVNSENKLDYTQIATVINTGINDKHWLKNGDLLFAAKGGSNYCIQYEGTERSTIASSSFIIIRPVISNILPNPLLFFKYIVHSWYVEECSSRYRYSGDSSIGNGGNTA